MIGLAVALIALVLVAMFIGLSLGRVIHYARGFEAGVDHACRTVRAAVIEGSYR